MHVQHILETCLYVDDLEAAEVFYRDVLGLTFVSRQAGRHVFFRCGQRMLLLFNPSESQATDQHFPPHGASGAGHVAFAVAEMSLGDWQQRLTERGIAVERIIDWPGGGRSVYFRDPAGNSLELATPRIWGISEDTLSSVAEPADREASDPSAY
jgi:catechol 2,3-dioxygenase-like lactoylglutathione lyase family enzyme